ncbi:MAG: RNase P subunit p30 family protein [Candidatus Thorarchaeota archaeon]
MSSLDLGVYVSDLKVLESFIEMAKKIGLSGFTAQNVEDGPLIKLNDGFSVLSRADISGRGLNSIRKRVSNVREESMIVAVPLTTVEIANWAAEDKRVDLITLEPSREHRLRDSTARLAASSGTCLEVQFSPLLNSVGLNRSKIIKTFRESVHTATDAGMSVILSSGAKNPLHMRSAMAMRHIGILLGMDSKYAETVVCKTPFEILERNQRRFTPEFVLEGVKIIQRGGNE